MAIFFRRFVGALALDAGAFEDIEADRRADLQSVLVVLAVALAGGMAAFGLGLTGTRGFVAGAIVILGGWLVWVAMIASVGTTTLAEAETKSNVHELLRVLGYAAAPGVFLAFASMRAAAPVVLVLVVIWMMAAAVLAVRQALDFHSTMRAIAVCVVALALSAGVVALIVLIGTQRVG
jgi:hypothetical protein